VDWATAPSSARLYRRRSCTSAVSGLSGESAGRFFPHLSRGGPRDGEATVGAD
jgi:hypothetical protein